MNRKQVFARANQLVGEGQSRSDAMKQAWKEYKAVKKRQDMIDNLKSSVPFKFPFCPRQLSEDDLDKQAKFEEWLGLKKKKLNREHA